MRDVYKDRDTPTFQGKKYKRAQIHKDRKRQNTDSARHIIIQVQNKRHSFTSKAQTQTMFLNLCVKTVQKLIHNSNHTDPGTQ